eukprot:s611_g2.t1
MAALCHARHGIARCAGSGNEPRMPGTHRVVLNLPKTRIWLCAESQALAKHWYRSIPLAQRICDSKRGKRLVTRW